MKRIISLLIVISFLFSALQFSTQAFSGEVTVGAGSYSNILPPGAVDAPSTIYKTNNVTGKMPTNDWWSSLAWMQYSEAQYPHPLAVKNQSDGFRIYYPGNRISANSAAIMGWINDIHDFTVTNSSVGSFPDARVDGFSDWFVKAAYQSGNNKMTVSYGHGSPYVYFDFVGGNPKLSFYTPPTVWSGNANTPILGITMAGAHYGLFGANGSTWSGIGSKTFTNNGSSYFTVAVLPDNSQATLNKFAQYAYSFVTDTKVSWSYNSNTSEVVTNYTVTTNARQGSQSGTIFALYPHQWKNLTTSTLSYSYNSVRGTMKTAEGTSFQTKMKFNGVLPTLPDKGTYNKTTLAQYVNEAAGETYPNNADTYWVGKRMGKLATLAPIADQVGNSNAASQFRNEIKTRLQDWLKASDGSGNLQSGNLFYYNNNWGTLIGYPASFGSNDELNDHHFHYGYFIKAAAEIARTDKNWANSWGSMINMLIRDIASTDRNDSMFPFMRNFDLYAGHSWASGHGRFGDGNNNESSSEAMNAWAGMILWGEATGNTSIRDTGIYLYTTEMNAINEYWFDVNGTNFPASFTRSTASMVWGGKTVGDGTWWTANPEEVHGINWLPITGASLYLTQYPSYTAENYNALVAENGGTNFSPWEDIIYMYRAISNINEAKSMWASRGAALTAEEGNSKANAYHWIHNLDAMGTIDRTVTANTPLYAVFSKNGVKTYIVYNMSNTSKTVTFSDGQVVTVPANSFNTGNGSGGGDDGGSSDIDTSKTYKLINVNSNKALDVSGSGTTDGTNVQIWEDNGTGAQQWILSKNSDNTYKLKNVNSQKVLDVNAAGTSDGTNVQIWTDNGTGAQKWNIIKNSDGSYKLINPNSNKALDVSSSGTSNGTNVQIWTDNGTGAQKWRIIEVSSSGGGNGDPNQHVTPDYTAKVTRNSGSQATIEFTPNTNAVYVDVHFKINNGGQLNYRMSKSGNTWQHVVNGLSSGSTIEYWFTYEKNGPQYDSPHYNYTH